MKKAVYLIVFILSIWQLANALPPGNDPASNTAFLERAKEYVNTKLTYAILQTDFVRSRDANNKIELIQDQLKENSIENPLTYQNLHTLLEGKFEGVDTKFSSKVNSINISKFANASLEDGIEKLMQEVNGALKSSYLHNEPALSAKSDEILAELKQVLQEANQSSAGDSGVQGVISANQEVGSEPKQEPDFMDLSHVNFWVILPIVLTIGAFLFLYGEINRLSKEVRQSSNKSYSGVSAYEELARVDQKDINRLENKLVKQSELLEVLNDKVAKLEQVKQDFGNISSHHTDDSDPSKRGNSTNSNKKNTQEPLETFFMVAPSYDYFPLNAKTLAREHALYKFTVERNKSVATFEVINDGASVADAANYASTYFDPVCDAQNRPRDVVRKVKTSTPGTATFDGDKWVVKDKAVIIYE